MIFFIIEKQEKIKNYRKRKEKEKQGKEKILRNKKSGMNEK